jgi:protein TonB
MDAKQILSGDLDDIIFENRNKAYGAYEIRKKYRDRVNLALLIAVTFVVLALLSPYIAALFSRPEVIEKPKPHVTTVNELAAPPPLENTPPPPTYTPPPPKQIVFTPPKVVREEVKAPPPPTNEELQKTQTSTTNNDGPSTYVPPKDPPKEIPKEIPEEIIETGFDENPEPPGGAAGYAKYLAEHIKYPARAIDAGVQGTVYISLVVDKTGNVSDVKIKSDRVGYGCGEEAVNVISKMPPWKPGKMGGKPVKVRYTIPVKFLLH